MRGAGDSLGDNPRGDLTRCVPKVAPLLLLLREAEPGVLGLLGAEKGPFRVGVIARVVAAMVYGCLVKQSWARVSTERMNECELGCAGKFGVSRMHCYYSRWEWMRCGCDKPFVS